MNRLFCIVDIELTEDKEIIQFSAVKLDDTLKELESINYYIKPKKQVSSFVTELTGISNEMLADKMHFEDVAVELYNFIKDDILVCHGLPSDYAAKIAKKVYEAYFGKKSNSETNAATVNTQVQQNNRQ